MTFYFDIPGEETLGDIEPDQGDNRRTAGVRFGGQSLQHKDGENEVAAETLSVQSPSPAYALLGNVYLFTIKVRVTSH